MIAIVDSQCLPQTIEECSVSLTFLMMLSSETQTTSRWLLFYLPLTPISLPMAMTEDCRERPLVNTVKMHTLEMGIAEVMTETHTFVKMALGAFAVKAMV